MRILTVSDVIVDIIHSPVLAKRFGDVDFILGCGDLPINYMEYIASILIKPFYYVHGNHAQHVIIRETGVEQVQAEGCVNLHRRVANQKGILIAGLEGSMRYNNGPHQYSDREMGYMTKMLAPKLLWNRWHHGRYLDILITHAPPLGIHDREDLCHRGFSSFLGFMERYKPQYLIHGHTHLYRLDAKRVTQYQETTVINTYGYQVIEIDESQLSSRMDVGGSRA